MEPYNKSLGHTHPLEEIDSMKISQAVRDAVAAEAVKCYAPPKIVGAVKELVKNDLGEGSGVEFLKSKEVSNIQQRLRGSINAQMIGMKELEMDLKASMKYLSDDGYYVKEFIVSASEKRGFAFARPEQLEKLTRYGWLTLIDSTHNTNKWRWRLFTLYVRDACGCWDVGAHFFVNGEDSPVVVEALKKIRSFVTGWIPRYMLSDQSAVEANAIRTVFRGLKAGETECDVILCTVHVMRTWMRRIYVPEIRSKMILAMHKRTRLGCEDLVKEAIASCSVPAVANYIKKSYSKNTKLWALWSRQHSPLLLQVTTTNPLESYHSELKAMISVTFGLIGEDLLASISQLDY